MSIFSLNSVTKRLLLGFISLIVIFGCVLGATITYDKRVSEAVTLAKVQSKKVLLLKDILLSLRAARVQIWAFAATDDANFLKIRDKAFGEASAQFDELFALLTNPAGRELVEEFRQAVSRFRETGTKLNDLKVAGNVASDPAYVAQLAELNKTGQDYTKALDKASAFYGALYDKALRDADDAVSLSTQISLFGGLIAILVSLAIAWIIGRGISKPLHGIVAAMEAMASGKLDQVVPSTDRSDELGKVARALETFKQGLAEAERLQSDAQMTESRNAERGRSERNKIADQFETRMGALAKAFSEAAGEMSNAAADLSSTAEQTSQQAGAVADAAQEASANVQTVAASTEEMSASIREIGSQVNQASDVSLTASNEAARTETEVRALAEAATKIGEVVELINNIASQTNLLALNATIEAARAGDMGRGFAVVAQEVKQLAAQTSKATEEIGQKIGEIQNATKVTVGSIEKIVGTIGQIRQISTTIASAIEEQGAATGEIASNTQRAAEGTEMVTKNITGVGNAARQTGNASAKLMQLSSGLTGQASALQREVGAFVQQLRAG